MFDLPNLDGQPGWVVVLVVALVVGGTMGVMLLRKRKDPDEKPTTAPVPDPAAILALQEALRHLASAATRSAEEAKAARADAEQLEDRLTKSTVDLVDLRHSHSELTLRHTELAARNSQLLADLDVCRQRVERLQAQLDRAV